MARVDTDGEQIDQLVTATARPKTPVMRFPKILRKRSATHDAAALITVPYGAFEALRNATAFHLRTFVARKDRADVFTTSRTGSEPKMNS
jgi:hypothetical protein